MSFGCQIIKLFIFYKANVFLNVWFYNKKTFHMLLSTKTEKKGYLKSKIIFQSMFLFALKADMSENNTF